ncbi:hypothetical protein M8R20_00680 [Pseudomonas sp. R2.Fl]|nr:hypothetical protein [Pseudomonas sp. R2.Fl]
MSVQLSRYLKDFSASAPVPEPELPSGFDDLGESFPPLAAPEPVDIEEERRQAYAEGYEAATAELTERHTAERADIETAHAEQLKQLSEERDARWGDAVARNLRRMVADMSASISEEVAKGLVPFLSEAVAEAAIAELAGKLEAALLAGEAGKVVVKGPAGLFEKLKDALPEAGDMLRHVPAEDLDLSVDVGDTVLVTRVSAWTASLKKVMG